MASKKDTPSNPFGALPDLTKVLEQFKVPGVDTQEILDARRKDIKALMQANQAIYQGMQAMANKQGELMQAAMADIQHAMQGGASGLAAGMGLGDPAKQGELARKAYEKMLGDMQDLAAIARQSQTEAMAKITERGNEHLEAVKRMMKGG
jgi:phasin family protein